MQVMVSRETVHQLKGSFKASPMEFIRSLQTMTTE